MIKKLLAINFFVFTALFSMHKENPTDTGWQNTELHVAIKDGDVQKCLQLLESPSIDINAKTFVAQRH